MQLCDNYPRCTGTTVVATIRDQSGKMTFLCSTCADEAMPAIAKMLSDAALEVTPHRPPGAYPGRR